MKVFTAGQTSSSTPRTGERVSIRKVAPWSVSLLLHIGVITVGFLVTWSIIRLDERLPSPVVTGDVAVVSPVVALHPAPSESMTTPPTIPMPDLSPAASSVPHITGPTPANSVETASTPPAFAGASMGVAREVVFVIDASGSMTAWLPFVIDEVERTLAAMSGDQQFAVVYFAGDVVRVTPKRGLVRVTPEAAAEVVATLRHTAGHQLGGGSDPSPAMKKAFSMRPELVLLLSEGLDGRGRWAVDRDATLRALDEYNSDRHTRVACIRLTTGERATPAKLMQAIAEAHGDGTVTTITLEELDR